jgi:hypothetical protein
MERWAPIGGYPDYEVSSLGRVASRKGRGRLLRPGTTKNGYRVVALYDGKGNKKSHNVHRLVAETFLPDFDPALEVNHKRGAAKGDALNNLEMVTPQQNIQHSFAVLKRKPSALGKFGADNPSSKRFRITHPDGCVEEIIGLLAFCREHGLSRDCMAHVAKGNQKQHKGYKIERI